jgi:hypothetical protein
MKIYIFSPINSGSNLLKQFLVKSGLEVHNGQSQTKDKDWKHSIFFNRIDSEARYILIIKNPFSWYESYLKMPYHTTLIDKDSITTTCLKFKTLSDPYQWDAIESIQLREMWLLYYNTYVELTKLRNVILLHFESFIRQPKTFLKMLSIFLQCEINTSDEFIAEILSKPSKNHGACNSYDTVITKTNPEYIKEIIDDLEEQQKYFGSRMKYSPMKKYLLYL